MYTIGALNQMTNC